MRDWFQEDSRGCSAAAISYHLFFHLNLEECSRFRCRSVLYCRLLMVIQGQRASSCLQASSLAFAAILADGSVATWGDPGRGGQSADVQHQLKGVTSVGLILHCC